MPPQDVSQKVSSHDAPPIAPHSGGSELNVRALGLPHTSCQCLLMTCVLGEINSQGLSGAQGVVSKRKHLLRSSRVGFWLTHAPAGIQFPLLHLAPQQSSPRKAPVRESGLLWWGPRFARGRPKRLPTERLATEILLEMKHYSGVAKNCRTAKPLRQLRRDLGNATEPAFRC
jgi:hypothetical protein